MSEIDTSVEANTSVEAVENENVEGEGLSAATGAEGEGSTDIQEVISDIFDEADGEEVDLEASAEEAVEEQIKDLKKKLKLKVDGEEFEEEIDLNDDERLVRALQKEKAFDKRVQEFSKQQKKVEQFVDSLKGNPFAVLEQMGVDVEDLVMDYARKAVEQSEKTPEQLAQEKMELELQELREEKERLSKDKETAELEKLKNQQAQEIQTDIKAALDAVETILPKKNPRVLAMIAETMYMAMTNGYPQVKAKDVIPLVEKRFEDDFRSMFDVFPEEIIERVVGKTNLDRVRKKRLKNRKVKTETAKQAVKQTNNKIEKESAESKDRKSYKDLFDPRF